MFNIRALGWFFSVCLAGLLSWITFPYVESNPDGPFAITSALSLGWALSCLGFCARSWRNFPTKYIPSGGYKICYAASDGKGILLTLSHCINLSGQSIGHKLSKTRLFYVPLEWLTSDYHLNDTTLFCLRVQGHPIITVSPAFLAQHPRVKKEELKTATAA